MSFKNIVQIALTAIALIGAGSSVWVIVTGGDDTTIWGLRVSLRAASRPFFVAGAATVQIGRAHV